MRHQAGFEIPPVLKASKILPKELHESKIYKISENVYVMELQIILKLTRSGVRQELVDF